MKILFLCIYMSGLHGSVLRILEYVKFIKSMNTDIFIDTVFIDHKIQNLAAREGFKLYRINNVPIDVEYDIVYSLHLFLFLHLIFKGISYKHSILALLSVKGPIEQSPPSCMYPYFEIITAISPEIVARYYNEFRLDHNMFTLVSNPLDFIAESNEKNECPGKLDKVAVVSNHKASELLEMAELATWHTDFFGIEYGNRVNITPDLLLG